MTRARELSKLINANSFSVDSDYNVGINSTSPDVKLDVGGAVLVTGISTFENTTQSTSPTTGALVISGGVGIAKSLNVGGNLSVAGTITYDDVTNIDSVGIVTAQSGVEFGVSGVGGTVTAVGNATFAGIVTASDGRLIAGVGINSAGTTIGTGITTLNFIGAGNTFAVNGTTVDISIQGGGGGGGITSLDITSSLFI